MPKNRAQAALVVLPSAGRQGDKPKSGPLSSKASRTRQSLLDAAKKVFEEQGSLEVRISDIVERAGQAHGSFYYYFESREQVFREVAAAVDERLFAPLQEVILAHSELSLHQRIHEATRRYFVNYRKEARIVGLIEHVSRYDPKVHAMQLARYRRHIQEVAESIRQLQRNKRADPRLDPVIAAAALGGLTQRFAETWLVHRAIDCTLEHAIDHVAQICLNALDIKHRPKLC
jgi:AcrR family transcriptional regulator